jgi:Tol biopolymer transport system component
MSTRRFSSLALVALGCMPLAAQSSTLSQVSLNGLLPPEVRPRQLVSTADARRTYYTDSLGQLWMAERSARTGRLLASGSQSDLTLSPGGDALAYTRSGDASREQYVWVQRLDPRTGLAAAPPRRASAMQGDVPAISPDGRWLAFALDDSTGVGQSVAIVALVAGGGHERTVAPALSGGVAFIRWTPDGQRLYFGVNPPVPCNPDWSCLPARGGTSQVMGTIRRVDAGGGAVTTVATAHSVWPGLSPDGSVIVYADTGRARRMVVADSGGRRLDTFVLPGNQSIEGWLARSTLLVSAPATVRRLREYSLADGHSHILLDSLDGLAAPAWSPDGKMISIVHCAASQCELRFLNADGSPRKAIPMQGPVIGNVWSPDGRWIAHVGSAPNEPFRIHAVDVATGEVMKLDRTSGSATLSWTADSRALMVTEAVGGAGGASSDARVVFRRVDLTGTARALRAFPRAQNELGGLALDSATAVLVRVGEDVQRVALDASGRDAVILKKPAGVYDSPAFSPDGQWIALRANPRRADVTRMNSLVLLRRDGTGRTTIALPFFTAPGGGGSSPVFAPRGDELFIGEIREPGRASAIYRITIATGAIRKVVTLPVNSYRAPELAVSPDGRNLLYLTMETISPWLYSMDLSPIRGTSHQ